MTGMGMDGSTELGTVMDGEMLITMGMAMDMAMGMKTGMGPVMGAGTAPYERTN